MSENQLRELIDGMRTRLQAELDAQLDTISNFHDQVVEDARRAASTAAEQEWRSALEQTQAEWTERLQSEIMAARAEVERTSVAEAMRVRVEAEQAVVDAVAQARRELEQALAAERQHAQEQLESVRLEVKAQHDSAHQQVEQAEAQLQALRQRAEQAEALIQAARQQAEQAEAQLKAACQRAGQAEAQLESERQHAREHLDAEREQSERRLADVRAMLDQERQRAAEALQEAASRPAPGGAADADTLLAAVKELDTANSLSSVLEVVVRAASAAAPRAGLFVVNGSELREWPVRGAQGLHAGTIDLAGAAAGVLGDAVRKGEPASTGGNGGTPGVPAFAALPQGRMATAVPFVMDGRTVAVLYADEGSDASGDAHPAWREKVHILGRHASACAAYLTALRTAQAARLVTEGRQTLAEGGASLLG